MAETRVGYPSHEHVLQVSGCHWTSTSSLPQGSPALLASASRSCCCMPICSKSQVAAGRWEGNEPRFLILVTIIAGGCWPRSRGPAQNCCVVGVPRSEGKRSEAKQNPGTAWRTQPQCPACSRRPSYTGTPALNAIDVERPWFADLGLDGYPRFSLNRN